MELFRWAARIAGLIGVVLSVVAGLSRLSGHYQLGSYQAITVLAARQTVPATHLRQAPAPSQVPSVPQLEAALAVHSLRGLVPGSENLHVPTLFVALQVWQVPLQAVSQQTPSAQWPLPQSVSSSHTVPIVSTGTHAEATQ